MQYYVGFKLDDAFKSPVGQTEHTKLHLSWIVNSGHVCQKHAISLQPDDKNVVIFISKSKLRRK